MSGGAERAVHLSIAGRVQGVGFRAFVQTEARALSLKGWVRNRRDGTVEAAAAGPSEAIETFLAACRRGPAGAQVSQIAVSEPVSAPHDAPFSVRATE